MGADNSYNPDDNLNFGEVQRWVAEKADELVREAVSSVLVPDEQVEEARLLIASRRAEIELAGVQAFERARRVHGDDHKAVPYKAYAARVMEAKLAETFRDEDEDEDGGTGGTTPARPPLPEAPSGGAAETSRRRQRVVVGDRQTTEDDQPVKTRGKLVVIASRMAAKEVQNVIGTWSDDSEATDEIEFTAAAKGVDRWERRWDPEKGSLLGYLNRCVTSVVQDEYRKLCKRKAGDARVVEFLEKSLADQVRDYTGTTNDQIDHGSSVDLEARRIVAALDNLSPRQRGEFLRRVLTDVPGDASDANAYSRALASIRKELSQRAA